MNVRSSRRRGGARSAFHLVNRANWILVWALLLHASQASALEMLLMLPVSGQNVSASVANQVRALVMERLATHCQDCWIRNQPGAPTVWGMDGAAAVDLARSLGADGILALNVGHEVRGGGAGGGPGVGSAGGSAGGPADNARGPSAGTTVLTLTAYVWGPSRFPSGRTIQVQRGTNAAPDAMRPVADSLVRELFAAAGAVLDVAEDHGDGVSAAGASRDLPTRQPRRLFVGVQAGVTLLFGTPAGGSVTFPSVGLLVLYRGAASLLDAQADRGDDGLKQVSSLALGIHHRWGERWFGGCVTRWVWQHVGGRGASGPVLQPTVGWLLPLDPSPVVRLDVGYSVSLFQERGTDRLIVGSGGAHRSHGPVATIGVAF